MVRTFIAIQFPDRIKHLIDESITPLRDQVGDRFVRWVDASLYHLTVKFLGDVKEELLGDIQQVIRECGSAGQCFELDVGDFGVFPGIRKPRVLWVGLEARSNALTSLKESLERSLAPLGFDRENRNFHPHVTVGRVRRRVSHQDTVNLATTLDGFSLGRLAEMKIDQVFLMRSELTSSGPIYTPIGRFQLGSGD